LSNHELALEAPSQRCRRQSCATSLDAPTASPPEFCGCLFAIRQINSHWPRNQGETLIGIFGRSEPNVGYDYETNCTRPRNPSEYELYERLASQKRQVQESRQRWHAWGDSGLITYLSLNFPIEVYCRGCCAGDEGAITN
jgi:hypothetical protein